MIPPLGTGYDDSIQLMDQNQNPKPRIRSSPEDFFVEEIPLYEPEGRGDHCWLEVEKRRRNTMEVARYLADLVPCPRREVGFAGRKDRQAVTRQWFSVPRLPLEKALSIREEGLRVLQAHLNSTKLHLGDHRGNRFQLWIRGMVPEQIDTFSRRLVELEKRGMPNRFGRQRFGYEGSNLEKAKRLLSGERLRVDRKTQRFVLSAIQSAVFNDILERRSVPVDGLLEGDWAEEIATERWIMVKDPSEFSEQLKRFEVSATALMPGVRTRRAKGEVLILEEEVAAAWGLTQEAMDSLPRKIQPKGERRKVRVKLDRVDWGAEGGDVRLGVDLPSGSFVTVLLDELIPMGFEEGPVS